MLGSWLRVVVLAAAALASVATSPGRRIVRGFPTWRVTPEPVLGAGCATAKPWVVRSGKTGFGLAIALRPAPAAQACRVGIAGATLRLAGGQAVQVQGVPEVATGTAPSQLYLPVPFDANAAWNDGEREAVLALHLTVDGVALPPSELHLVHEWPAQHVLEREPTSLGGVPKHDDGEAP